MNLEYEDFLALEDKQDIISFKDEYGIVFEKVSDNIMKVLNETLETNYKALYFSKSEHSYSQRDRWKSGDISLSGEEFYVVTSIGRVIRFTNSEWGHIVDVKEGG